MIVDTSAIIRSLLDEVSDPHRMLTIGLLLLSGAAIALVFTFLENSETWLQILVAVMAVGAPLAAGWLSPRLKYVLLPPFVLLACLPVAFVLYGRTYWDSDPIVFTISLSVIYGVLTSVVFAAGWMMRWLVHQVRH